MVYLYSALAWTAAIAAVIAAALAWRNQQQGRDTLAAIRAERRTFPVPDGGQITVTAPMPDAQYEAFRTFWRATHGKPSAVCEAYQVPSSSEESGLCARCGMFDYKHQESTDA